MTMPALMSDDAIISFLNSRSMRNTTWFVNPVFESHHGAVHNWVGGVMANVPISPFDPVFFLHHAFIDCLWEQQRNIQRGENPSLDPQFDYPNDSVALGIDMEQPDGSILRYPENSHHRALNPMHPFEPLRNIDGLRNVYFDDFYTCQHSPRCSRFVPTCGSPYLFCDFSVYRCAPKLLLGADCGRFRNSYPCMNGVCCDGTCKQSCARQQPPRDRDSNRRPNGHDAQFYDDNDIIEQLQQELLYASSNQRSDNYRSRDFRP